MALTDASLNFVAPPPSPALSMVVAAGLAVPSNVIDLLGAGVGVAPPSIIGNVTLFGTDLGVDSQTKPLLICAVGTTFTTSTACTLNVQWQFAVDTGSAGGYLPGAWVTAVESGYMGVANLTAGTIIARLDFPLQFPANEQPRFMRLNFQTLSGASFTAGTIKFALISMGRDDYSIQYAAKNFTVS